MRSLRNVGCAVGLLTFSAAVAAQPADPTAAPSDDSPKAPTAATRDDSKAPPSEPAAPPDARFEIPSLAYAYTAPGVSKHTAGANAFGSGLAASGQDAVVGGGVTAWFAPIDRLTLVVDARRSFAKEFSPSLAGIVRLLGDPREGFTLGALGKFKVDGFSAGPSGDEVESEMEAGMLASYRTGGWQVDANAIGGVGLGDDGETDVEGRFRLARALGSSVQVGLDGQARFRLSGSRNLPNGRTWDFGAGPQVLVTSGHWFGALTVGPTTMGLVSTNVGWSALLSMGGTSF